MRHRIELETVLDLGQGLAAAKSELLRGALRVPVDWQEAQEERKPEPMAPLDVDDIKEKYLVFRRRRTLIFVIGFLAVLLVSIILMILAPFLGPDGADDPVFLGLLGSGGILFNIDLFWLVAHLLRNRSMKAVMEVQMVQEVNEAIRIHKLKYRETVQKFKERERNRIEIERLFLRGDEDLFLERLELLLAKSPTPSPVHALVAPAHERVLNILLAGGTVPGRGEEAQNWFLMMLALCQRLLRDSFLYFPESLLGAINISVFVEIDAAGHDKCVFSLQVGRHEVLKTTRHENLNEYFQSLGARIGFGIRGFNEVEDFQGYRSSAYIDPRGGNARVQTDESPLMRDGRSIVVLYTRGAVGLTD
ncbi:MAG: hypothetical protein A2284_04820 [Deltaproteobacteria bacterium RIFOXYA12_FULL_61_11]|nr:MAG: hypothetical protein A2284_04820 [Deltaproteobacteria bacterium RIFOXYA12_FULL_61_11]